MAFTSQAGRKSQSSVTCLSNIPRLVNILLLVLAAEMMMMIDKCHTCIPFCLMAEVRQMVVTLRTGAHLEDHQVIQSTVLSSAQPVPLARILSAHLEVQVIRTVHLEAPAVHPDHLGALAILSCHQVQPSDHPVPDHLVQSLQALVQGMVLVGGCRRLHGPREFREG